VLLKEKYTYKADVWSIGAILFEFVTGLTPFHAKNKQELEIKLDKAIYTIKDSKELTLECVSFLSQCLQYDENDRRSHLDLIKHPYVTTEYDRQRQTNIEGINSILYNQNDKTSDRSLYTSCIHRVIIDAKKHNTMIVFNARDANQAE